MENQNRILLWDVLNSTIGVLREKHPSVYLPFKGDLPLIKDWQEDLFEKGVYGKEYLDECEDWIQQILIKGQYIADIDNHFKEYLEFNGLSKKYFDLNGKQKAFEIKRFFDANCLDVSCLLVSFKCSYGQ